MSGFSLKRLALTILIALLACSSSFQACSARKAMYTRQLKTIGKGYDGYNYQDPKLMGEGNGVTPLKNTGSSTFNVLHFGAKGDGKADDTKVIFKCLLFVASYLFPHRLKNKYKFTYK